MAIDTNELERFRDFINEHIQNGGTDLSPEQLLDDWRCQNPVAADLAASVADLEQGISEMEAGDTGRPARDVIGDLRQELANRDET